MLEVDLPAMRQYVEKLDYRPLFVTVSGAHVYGFPSADSDVDLRACHQARLAELEARLDQAFADSRLPEEHDRKPISEFLIELRLSSGKSAS